MKFDSHSLPAGSLKTPETYPPTSHSGDEKRPAGDLKKKTTVLVVERKKHIWKNDDESKLEILSSPIFRVKIKDIWVVTT